VTVSVTHDNQQSIQISSQIYISAFYAMIETNSGKSDKNKLVVLSPKVSWPAHYCLICKKRKPLWHAVSPMY